MIELLVVTAVVALLMALILPALAQARLRGAVADDLSKLRQLGIAESLYAEQNGGFAFSPTGLVAAGYVPSSLLASSADSTSKGIGNEVHARNPLPKPPPYKVSFLSLGDTLGIWDRDKQKIGLEAYQPLFAADATAGWLVSPVPVTACASSTDYEFRAPVPWESWLRRLRLDGSVSQRFCIYGKMGARMGYCTTNAFFDASAQCGGQLP